MAALSSFAADPPPVDYHEYLRSPQWRARRREALWAADYACASCGSVARLDVHHVSYERLGRELPEDLRVLCRDCHDAVHVKLDVDRWWARVDGWTQKTYGRRYVERGRAEREFIGWLDGRGEGESVPAWVRQEMRD